MIIFSSPYKISCYCILNFSTINSLTFISFFIFPNCFRSNQSSSLSIRENPPSVDSCGGVFVPTVQRGEESGGVTCRRLSSRQLATPLLRKNPHPRHYTSLIIYVCVCVFVWRRRRRRNSWKSGKSR